jgi:hypothetical protein
MSEQWPAEKPDVSDVEDEIEEAESEVEDAYGEPDDADDEPELHVHEHSDDDGIEIPSDVELLEGEVRSTRPVSASSPRARSRKRRTRC